MKNSFFFLITSVLIAAQSPAGGQTTKWQSGNFPSSQTGITCLIANNTTLLAGTDIGGVFRSTDYGADWISADSGLPSNTTEVISFGVKDSTIFAGTSNFSGGTNGYGVYRSTNNGVTWQAANTGIATASVSSIVVQDSGLYAATWGGGVYYSSNDGTMWKQMNTGLPNLDVGILSLCGATLFAEVGIVPNCATYYSTDGGNFWQQLGINLSGSNVANCFTETGAYIFVGVDSGMYRSPIDGGTWSRADSGLQVPEPTGLTNVPVGALTTYRNAVFAGTYSYGVYLSTDNGAFWTPENTGLPVNTSIAAFATIGSKLFIGTYNNQLISQIYSADVSGIGSAVSEPLSVTRTLSLTAFPNPFSSSTTISFSLPQSGAAMLKVYDALGREVSTLVNGKINSGAHSIQFDGSNLPDGMYFYRLAGGTFSQCGEMAVVK